MTKSAQPWRWISRSSLRAVSSALTLVVSLGSGLAATQSARAQTFAVLYNFTGGTDGEYSHAGLVRDNAGNLYGTTTFGGSSGYGVVFKVDTSGTETVLHSFTGGSDGGNPYAGLIRDKAGALYGTAGVGGDLSCNGGAGCGVVFKVDTRGTETVLYSFTGGTSDGCGPMGVLLRDKAGNLYGTTQGCGAFSNHGTVFRLSKMGKETLLHSFSGGMTDGGYPWGGVIRDAKGSLYGDTSGGGTSSNGTVYKLSKSGTLTVLYSFAGGMTDGCYPLGTPAMDNNSNLYGTTSACGSGYGTVWKVSKRGIETVLHNFAGGSSDGGDPWAGVTLDAKGKLYGDTYLGTVYELNKKGILTVLHSFAGSDGEQPLGAVIRDAKGNLYGTAFQGGTGGGGTVWKLTP
jgi:uncharacterized repeat protein (TIGR03803 family)